MYFSECEKRNLGLTTRCIHAGKDVDQETRAIRRPIVMANSFRLDDDLEHLGEAFDWDQQRRYDYPRSRHPNARYLEERLAAIEGGEDCVVAASGVAAIAGAFFTLLSAGDHIVSSKICYIGIHGLLVDHLAKRFGVEVTLVDTTDLKAVKRAIRPDTKIVHIETPANPTTLVTDIRAVVEAARHAGADGPIVTVDSTYSGVVLQQPIELGADLVFHSLTKYVNGHGDGLGGAVIGRKDLIRKIRESAMVHLGPTISPFNAWLLMRSSVTLPMRMQRHSANGMAVAEFLQSDPRVAFVRYPGLPSHPQHEVAKRQMSGYSGMMNFGLPGGPDVYFEFLKRLRVIAHAVCLGHDESLVQYYPQDGNHPELGVLNYPEDLGPGFLRLSVGLEDPEDLIADLDRGLQAVSTNKS